MAKSEGLSPAIVVPVYKTKLTPAEIYSLTTLKSRLGHFPIVFVGPRSCLKGPHREIIPTARFECFPERFFASIDGYNFLMVSLGFYNRFRKYSHILIAQMDSLVIRDELLQWCETNFDYIGAPFFDGFSLATESSELLGVGNGGFSLRAVASTRRVLMHLRFYRAFRELVALRYRLISNWNQVTLLVRHALLDDATRLLKRTRMVNEDYFWGVLVPRTVDWYSVAPVTDAANFAFEANPRILIKMTGKLPFGCHAWERYDPDFWIEQGVVGQQSISG